MKDQNIKKEYYKSKDKGRIVVRLNPEEKTLLELAMREEEWNNVSGFIKYKLFGFDTDYKIKKVITSRNGENIALLIQNELAELNNNLAYFRYRYDRDMNQLYREEGVNVQDWKNATVDWHKRALEKMKDIYQSIKDISRELDIEISRSSEAPNPQETKYSDTEALDKIARDIYDRIPIENS